MIIEFNKSNSQLIFHEYHIYNLTIKNIYLSGCILFYHNFFIGNNNKLKEMLISAMLFAVILKKCQKNSIYFFLFGLNSIFNYLFGSFVRNSFNIVQWCLSMNFGLQIFAQINDDIHIIWCWFVIIDII